MPRNKKGFTLIELLAVIIILAVVALIATPIILNLVEDAKSEADMRTIDGLVDGGRQYCANAMFDTEAKENIDNGINIYNEILVNGSKPATGEIYVNDKCQVSIKIVQNDKCYVKKFDENIQVKKSNCNDYIGEDNIAPTVELSLISGTINASGWSKEDLKIKVNIKDNESGPSHYKWCSDVSDCVPSSIVESSSGIIAVKAEGNNKICVIGYDNVGKESELKCSDTYKIDKTKPTIEGIEDITTIKGETVDLTTGITVNDSLSGLNESYDYNPKEVDTSKTGITNVIYTVNDVAGNKIEVTRKVIVDAEAPTITYTPLGDKINGAGWSKENFFVKVDLVDNSGLGIKEGKWCSSNTDDTCTPNAVISGTTLTPQISLEGSNRICVEATDNNNKTSEVSCSDIYKLDKTAPTVGTATISGTLGSNNWYTSNVTITPVNGTDSLSGHGTTTTDVSSVTSNIAEQVITITTIDVAGNSSTRKYTVKVDKNAPTLTAKTETFEIIQGDNVNTSTYFDNPSYSISSGSLNCNPVNTSSLEVGKQSITCTATGNNGLSSSATKTITVKSNCPNCLTTKLLNQYSSSNTVGLLKDGDNYYYKGTNNEVANNFVWYEGHLWRVIQINSDNTITMITQQPITAINPAAKPWYNKYEYESSHVNHWLNNAFYNSISDKSKIKQSTFNVGIINNVSEITSTQYVGLLDVDQYTRAGLSNSYLDIKDYFWSSNRANTINIRSIGENGDLSNGAAPERSRGVRPVIKITDLIITAGNGTLIDPFREDSKSTNTSDVKVGEYISVPGGGSYCTVTSGRCLFRVVSKDSDSIKVILNGLLSATSKFGNTASDITFTLNSTTTPVYGTLRDFTNTISTTYRYDASKLFNIGMYADGAFYLSISSKTVYSNVGLPVVGEMFSGNDIDVTNPFDGPKIFVNNKTIENPTVMNSFWPMNTYSSVYIRVYSSNGIMSYDNPSTYARGVRPTLFLKLGSSSDLTFTKGEGTAENPYWLGN